jgi:phage gp36-like protein
MTANEEISAAMARIEAEQEEDRQRERYRRAMRILREIPSGTRDADLTDEQHTAWRDHDEAIAWLERREHD